MTKRNTSNQALARNSIDDIMKLNMQIFGNIGLGGQAPASGRGGFIDAGIDKLGDRNANEREGSFINAGLDQSWSGNQSSIGDSSARTQKFGIRIPKIGGNPIKQLTGSVSSGVDKAKENAYHANQSLPDSQDFKNIEDSAKTMGEQVGPVLQDVAMGGLNGYASGGPAGMILGAGSASMQGAMARADERKAERLANGEKMKFEDTIQDRLLNEFGDGTSENQGRQFTPAYQQDNRYDDLQSRLYDYARNNGANQERSTNIRERDKSSAYNNHGGRMNDINSGYQNVNNGYGQAMSAQDQQLMQAMGMTNRIHNPAVNQANQFGNTSTSAQNLNNYQADPRFLNSVSGNLDRATGNYENIQNNSEALIQSAMERFNEEEAESIKDYQDMIANQGLDGSGAEWNAINDIKAQFSKDKRRSIQDIMQSEQQRVFGNQQASMNQMNNLANSGTGIQSNNLNQTLNASNGAQNAMRNRLDFTNQGSDRSMEALVQSLGFGQEAMNNQSGYADSQGRNYDRQLAISQLIGQNDIMSADQQYNSDMSGTQGKMDNTQILMQILRDQENRDMGYSDYGFNRDMQLSNRAMQEVNALNGQQAQANAQNNFQANMDYKKNADKNAQYAQLASGAVKTLASTDWSKIFGNNTGISGAGVGMDWGMGTSGWA